MELLSPHKMAGIRQSRVPTETEKLGSMVKDHALQLFLAISVHSPDLDIC